MTAIRQWIRENGCRWGFKDMWNSHVCAIQAAANGGQMEVLKWAKENGYNRVPKICMIYAKQNKEIIEWAKSLTNDN
jgi:hypothetical protein